MPEEDIGEPGFGPVNDDDDGLGMAFVGAVVLLIIGFTLGSYYYATKKEESLQVIEEPAKTSGLDRSSSRSVVVTDFADAPEWVRFAKK